MATNDQEEFLKAFRGDENETAESAPEGESETPAVAVVIDPKVAVDENTDGAMPDGEQPQEGGEQSQEVGEQQELPMSDGQMPEGGIEQEAAMEGESVGQEAAEEGMSPEDIQRQKSWEGRLRKREEEIAAREAAMQSNPALDVVDDADISEIQTRLADDFGEEFVQMIMKLAAYQAQKMAESGVTEKMGGISSTIDQLISETKQAFSDMHYGAIADAHEDFLEIAGSEEFHQWINSMPEQQRATVEQVIEHGRPGQVIKLLGDFKEFVKSKEASSEDANALAMDAASGVRSSSPVKLPDRVPMNAEDEYRAAWASM